MDKSQLLGSQTAKNGFNNEHDIANKFNDWVRDEDAQKWLVIMDYKLEKVESVKAVVLSGYKADVNVQITITLKEAINVENIQVKLVSNKAGFNQIDKRWVDKYVSLWNIPEDVTNILKRFTGELKPTISKTRDKKKRRMFIDEFLIGERTKLIKFLNKNRPLIVNDVLRGRGEFAAEWVIVAQKISEKTRWILKNINEVVNHYDGNIAITKQGNIKIGRITMQRKGGDNGRETAKMLQFKINPAELFEI